MQAGPGVGLVCRPLEPYAAHLFTTRQWLLGSAGTPGARSDGWAEVARAMDVAATHLVRLNQVHGSAHVVAGVRAGPDDTLPAADIVLTDRLDLAVAVQAADCVPLLIADTGERTARQAHQAHQGGSARAVAAAHAGWRGLVARVPERTVTALGRERGSRPQDLIAVIGPSIGRCCYEVGLDVREQFAQAGVGEDALGRWFSSAPVPSARNPAMPGLSPTRRDRHWYFDGWLAARDQLVAAGVPETSIYCAELCTASHPTWLCSYRRDRSPAGRLAGAIRSRPRP